MKIYFLSLFSISGCADSLPPALAIQPPSESVQRGEIAVPVFVEPGATLSAWIDDGPQQALTAEIWRIDGTTLDDRTHTCHLQATDRAGNISRLSFSVATDNTPPTLTLSPTSGQQGRSMGLVVSSDEPLASITGQFLERDRTFYPLDAQTSRALVGVAIQQEAGEHPLTLQAADAAGNATTVALPITIETTDFPRGGFIRLSRTQTAARKDEPARARTRKERNDAYTVRTPEALWDGPLMRPVSGRRTSGFGRYRAY